VRLDALIFDGELLEAVLSNLSSETEAKQLRALRVDPATLAPAERFCFEMARLPRLSPMLNALRLRQSLPVSLGRATGALNAVSTAAQELMQSAAFVKVLASMLRHGNFLNAGTARGGARGFGLDGIEKMRALKSADGRTSLLEHACTATGLSRKQLVAELSHVRPACQLPLLDVLRIVKEVEDGIEIVGQELALCPLPDIEADVAAEAAEVLPAQSTPTNEQQLVARRFRTAMAPFYTEMQHGLETLTASRDETRALLRKLTAWLGEDPAKTNPDVLLKTCADLVDTAIRSAPSVDESEASP
jgi:hypothetical protein